MSTHLTAQPGDVVTPAFVAATRPGRSSIAIYPTSGDPVIAGDVLSDHETGDRVEYRAVAGAGRITVRAFARLVDVSAAAYGVEVVEVVR